MSNLYEMWTGAQANGAARVKQSQLAGLVNPAIGGDKAAQARMIGLDPEMGMKVQGFADTRAKGQQDAQATAQKRIGSLAAGVVQASKGGDPASVQGAYNALLQEARAANPQAQLSDVYDPNDLPEIHKLVALGGGSTQGEQYTLAPGAKRFGADNKLIAEAPFAPARPDFVMYDSADGPVWLPKPGTGGAPQAGPPSAGPSGGASSVLDGAFTGSMPTPETFAGIATEFPGVQLTSTKRTPERNAAVGGKPNSQHLRGTAGDFVVPDAQKPAFMAAMRAKGLHPIDEGDHIHVQQPRGASQPAPGGVNAIPIGGVRPKPKAAQLPSELERKLELARQMGASPAELRQMVIGKPDGADANKPKELTGELKLKKSLFENARRSAGEWQALVTGPGGEFNDLRARTPQAQALLRAAIGNKLRAESGAAISAEEISNETARYLGGLMSSDKTNVNQAGMLIKDLDNQLSSLGGGATKPPPSGGIKPGHVEDGYRYKGGDEANPNSWEKI